MIPVILGIGIIAFLLCYIAFSLNKDHWPLQVFTLMVVIFMLSLIPTALLNTQDHCSTQISNTTTINNQTTYNYQEYCFTETKTHNETLNLFVLWYQRAFMGYIVVALLVYLFKTYKNVTRKK